MSIMFIFLAARSLDPPPPPPPHPYGIGRHLADGKYLMPYQHPPQAMCDIKTGRAKFNITKPPMHILPGLNELFYY